MAYSTRQIANRLLELVFEYRERFGKQTYLYSLELQKLVVISHAIHRKLHGERLVDEELTYNEFEPIFRSLENALIYYGDRPVNRAISDGDSLDVFLASEEVIQVELDPRAEKTVRTVADMFLKYKPSCSALSKLTRGSAENWNFEYQRLSNRQQRSYPEADIIKRLEDISEISIDNHNTDEAA
ncbi:MAG: hypothetical protein OIF58_05240 [Cohaesibacter sp.]|nr:hypothetical protein [Cohaesibacter sp.]